MNNTIPDHLLEYLGAYGEQLYDGWCDEPTMWGYKIVKHCGEEIWAELHKYGDSECSHSSYPPQWYLITKKLTPEEAIKKYGKITELGVGPRGGFKHIIYGDKKFGSRLVEPDELKPEMLSSNYKKVII